MQTALLFIELAIADIASAEKIIKRDTEIIGKHNERFIIGLALHIFVSADAILIHVKIYGKLQLRYSSPLAYFLEPEFHIFSFFHQTS